MSLVYSCRFREKRVAVVIPPSIILYANPEEAAHRRIRFTNFSLRGSLIYMNAIEIQDLSKVFGRGKNKVTALNKINFTVKQGSITGFLGPNGAGKSTTIDTLLGFINPTGGKIMIFGRNVDVNSVDTRRGVGFLSNNMALDKTMRVSDELEYFGYLSGRYDKLQVAHLAKRLGLDLRAKIGDLSTGNYQKVGLVIALMNRPRLLILDEPTNGLDPLVQDEFNKIIVQMRDAGTTIFISSHILSEISAICDQFVFIRDGEVLAQLSADELAQKSSKTLRISVTSQNSASIENLLLKNNVKYDVESGDLERGFMQLYGEA